MDEYTKRNYVNTIKQLHSRFTPHAGQQKAGIKLFTENIRRLFLQCGRKWGKTEFILYVLYRWAHTFPESSCYYISPFFKQSKEIIWANKRVQTFCPKNWLLPGSQGLNNTELRANLTNGSFIKLDGSDNYTAYDGIQPSLVVYDEFRDFRPEFHERMAPNLAVFDAPLLIIGTPPNREGQYTEIAEEFKADPYSFWYRGPTWENPHISPEWLGHEKARLLARGEADVWFRDYGAEFIIGGSNSIFPMWSRDFIRPHRKIIHEIARERSKLNWIVVADPGTASVTGCLFCAHNPYNSKFYILDEIYCKDPKENTVSKIGKEIIEKRHHIESRAEWDKVYDEAAKWWQMEMIDRYDDAWMPTRKELNKKEQGLSLMKDCMLSGNFIVSDKCKYLPWEIENYVKDKNGKIPKKDDHLIDCVRYALGHLNYSLNNEIINISDVDKLAINEQRMISLDQDMRSWSEDNMTFNIKIGDDDGF